MKVLKHLYFFLTCAAAPRYCFEVHSEMHPHYLAACSSGVGLPLLLCLNTQHLDDTCFPQPHLNILSVPLSNAQSIYVLPVT